MAQRKELKIRLSTEGANQVRSQMSAIDKTVDKLKQQFMNLGIALVGAFTIQKVFQGMKSMINASIEQEKIFKVLQTSIEITGENYDLLAGQINRSFASLQKMTQFGDTESAAVLTTLIQLTSDYKKSMDVLPLVLDIGASGLFDVGTAARYVAMGLEGNIEMMGRYIPEFRAANNEWLKGASQAEKVGFFIQKLNEKFGGTAQKNIETTAGSFQQLNNRVGDLSEAIGDKLTPAITDFNKESLITIDNLTVLVEHIKIEHGEGKGLSRLLKLLLQAAPQFAILSKTVDILNQFLQTGADRIRRMKGEGENFELMFRVLNPTIGKTVDVVKELTEEQKKLAESIQKKIALNKIELDDTLNSTQRKIAIINMEFREIIEKAEGNKQLEISINQLKAQEIEKIYQELFASIQAQYDENFKAMSKKFKMPDIEMPEIEAIEVPETLSGNFAALADDPSWTILTNKANQFSSILSNAIVTQWQRGESALENFVEAFKSALAAMVAEILAKAAIFGLLQLITGGGFGVANQMGLGQFLFGGVRAAGGGKQHGGAVGPGLAFPVGEGGPEIFVPTQAGRIEPNRSTQNTFIIQALDPISFEQYLRTRGGAEAIVRTTGEVIQ